MRQLHYSVYSANCAPFGLPCGGWLHQRLKVRSPSQLSLQARAGLAPTLLPRCVFKSASSHQHGRTPHPLMEHLSNIQSSLSLDIFSHALKDHFVPIKRISLFVYAITLSNPLVSFPRQSRAFSRDTETLHIPGSP